MSIYLRLVRSLVKYTDTDGYRILPERAKFPVRGGRGAGAEGAEHGRDLGPGNLQLAAFADGHDHGPLFTLKGCGSSFCRVHNHIPTFCHIRITNGQPNS